MSYLKKVISGTCPNCGKTKLFYEKGNPFLFKMPKMKKECSECGYNFHRETGFYFGAMYVSYALTVAEMVAVIVLGLIFEITLVQMFIIIAIVSILLSTFNYKVARIMWLNMFYKEE